MDRLSIMFFAAVIGLRERLAPDRSNPERGDVPGWVLITLMTASLVVLIWGVASTRLIEIFNRALDSLSGI